MDPNANLAEQRHLAAQMISRAASLPETVNARERATVNRLQRVDGERLAELVQALDDWLSSDGSKDGHGCLPQAWDHAYTPIEVCSCSGGRWTKPGAHHNTYCALWREASAPAAAASEAAPTDERQSQALSYVHVLEARLQGQGLDYVDWQTIARQTGALLRVTRAAVRSFVMVSAAGESEGQS